MRRTKILLVLCAMFIACASSKVAKDVDLIHAAEVGDVDKVKSLVEQGANVNAQDENGWTPYLAASSNGHMEVMKLLRKAGAYIYPCSERRIN